MDLLQQDPTSDQFITQSIIYCPERGEAAACLPARLTGVTIVATRSRVEPALWLVSSTVVLALRCAPASAGCVCSRLPFPEDFARSSAIFVGTAVERTVLFDTCSWAFQNLPEDDPLYRKWEGRSVKFTLSVDESLKGPGEGTHFEVLSGDRCTGCTTRFELGQQYLVYTNPGDPEGEPDSARIDRIEICSRTDKIEYLERELYYLRQLKAHPDPGGTVFGMLVDEEGILERPPEVVLTSRRGPRRVDVGESGEIQLTRLERGSYRLAVQLPPAVDPDPLIYEFVIRGSESVVDLSTIFLRPASRVEGRLIQADGRPAFGFQVMGKRVARTDRDGRFVLRHIRAGKGFPLSVCVPASAPSSDEADTECTYFPGVGDSSEAEEITLEPGQILTLPDLPIPWTSQRCDLAGIVVTPNGERAAGTQISDSLWWSVSEPQCFAGPTASFAYRLSVHDPHHLRFCFETEEDGQRLVYEAVTRIETGTCSAHSLTIELAPVAACAGGHAEAY